MYANIMCSLFAENVYIEGTNGGPEEWGLQVAAGLIVFRPQFFTCSNPHVDRCSNPLPWDPLIIIIIIIITIIITIIVIIIIITTTTTTSTYYFPLKGRTGGGRAAGSVARPRSRKSLRQHIYYTIDNIYIYIYIHIYVYIT